MKVTHVNGAGVKVLKYFKTIKTTSTLSLTPSYISAKG